MTEQTTHPNVEALKRAFDALNRNDIPAMAQIFDTQIEWTEPDHYPRGGTHRGMDAVVNHLQVSRDTWAEGTCRAERFLVAGDKVVVFVTVHVRLKDSTDWIDAELGDVYTFRNGLAVHMMHFPDRQDALAWAGATEKS